MKYLSNKGIERTSENSIYNCSEWNREIGKRLLRGQEVVARTNQCPP